MKHTLFASALLFTFTSAAAHGQQSSPASAVVSKSTSAIGYRVGGGSTKIAMKGTSLLPSAGGEAKIRARSGVTEIEAKLEGLYPATRFGAEFLTYVLWAVSPDGRTTNIGEIVTNKNGSGKLKTSAQLQTFSLLVSAEPYFSVRQPSEIVVAENEALPDTKGTVYPVGDYKLMQRTQYAKRDNPLALSLDLKNVPLEVYQARNAIEIARSRQAERYAAEIYGKAEESLKATEATMVRGANKKDILTAARRTVQIAEDARALSVQRQEDERIAAEQAAIAARVKAEAEARAAAEAARQAELVAAREAKLKAEAALQAELAAAREAQAKAEAARQAEAAAAREAQAKAAAEEARRRAEAESARQAEIAAAREAQMKAEAVAAAARAQAEADILKAKEEAARAEAERARAAAEALRAQLLEQFGRILETRDTARGLIVNMADVLFDVGKYNLRAPTREKLARLAGIILAHPGLSLEVEGHTDSTGGDELNQRLSEQRAGAVRTFLIEQGLQAEKVTAKGFGKTMPVADNATAAGRQQNRRVEIVVSGEVIGTQIGMR